MIPMLRLRLSNLLLRSLNALITSKNLRVRDFHVLNDYCTRKLCDMETFNMVYSCTAPSLMPKMHLEWMLEHYQFYIFGFLIAEHIDFSQDENWERTSSLPWETRWSWRLRITLRWSIFIFPPMKGKGPNVNFMPFLVVQVSCHLNSCLGKSIVDFSKISPVGPRHLRIRHSRTPHFHGW